MRRRTVLLTTAAGLLAPAGVPLPAAAAAPGAPAGGAAPAPTGPQLQRLLEALQRAGIPGLFAEVRDGRTRWPLAAGIAELDTGRPVRPGFQHRVGSITKTFVAATVLHLVGERRVHLDAPIGQYLPDVVTGPRARQVTVRMLLNHTSGLGNYTNAILANADDIVRAAQHTFAPRDLATVGLILPPTNAPGAAWSYSNTNYIILGLLIERLTRRPYAAEIERRILRPLGLRDTYFPGVEPRIRGPHSAAYLSWVDGSLRDFSVHNMSWAWAAGELVATAADLNTFFRALLTGRLLPPALLREMQTTVPFDPARPDAGGYGLGLFWAAMPCGRVWGHNGGVIGQTTVSLHTADGRRQVTLAENLVTADPAVLEPVGRAREEFLVTALCGPQSDGGRSSSGARPGLRLDRTVDVAPPH